MKRLLGLLAAVLLAATPALASVTTTGAGKVLTGGGGGGGAPSLMLNTTTGSVAGASQVYTLTGACTSGVAVIGLMTHGNNWASIVDSTGQTWTHSREVSSSSVHTQMFKAVMSGGGLSVGSTITIGWNFASQNSTSFVAACFPSGTGIPTTNDGDGDDGVNSTGITQTITGPTTATSYQYVAQAYSNNTTPPATGPDAPTTTGGWALDQIATTAESPGYGLKTYWRKATSTASTVLKTTAGGFSLTGTVWQEVVAP